MSADAPLLIGRTRSTRVHTLGQAVPTMGTGRRAPGDPVEKVEPKTAEEMREAERERRDAQPVVTRCGLCETWSFDGTALEGREQARTHRADAHPEMKVTKTRRDNLIGWKNNSPEQREAAMKIVMERRAFNARLEEGEGAGIGRDFGGSYAAGTKPKTASSPSSSRRSSPAQQAILDYLADGPKRLCEIAAHQGTKLATNGKTLHKLCERGLVVKRGLGVYALAPSRVEAA